jgi:cytochrome c-type biogenesis protein CcmH/NrfG
LIEPAHFDARFTLGRALFGVGEPSAAATAFRAAVKLKPDDRKALFFLATALESAGDFAGAQKAYQDLVLKKPEAAEGYLGLGSGEFGTSAAIAQPR